MADKQRSARENAIRLSVRALVEFTHHGEDIYPAGGTIRDMQEGVLGHKARQAMLSDGWQAEVPLSLTTALDDDEATLTVTGRMDAYLPGDVPEVEEIKLWQGREAPAEAIIAHEMQAVVYGHILCSQGAAQVLIRVCYVDRQGKLRAQFERQMTAAACADAFNALVEGYMRRWRIIHRHRRARDASLQALRFPFDKYRAGQRDMAVQVYTAIRLQRRLFASMPTGTGKSVAALFPALKALGAGLTEQVYYLTARTTQRQGALEAVARMRHQSLHLWTLTLDAKDKQCPDRTVCHPDWCPRARGHFLRDSAAIEEMMTQDDWSPEAIRRMADKHQLCPFELSLSLAEVADLTICDYNYALDPAVHIQRIFDRTADVTLLIDESHHLLDRVRDMLSGSIDGARIRKLRTVVGKAAGRKHPLYKAMTGMLNALADLPVAEDAQEGLLTEVPQSIDQAADALANAFMDAAMERFPWDEVGERLVDTTSALLGFLRARRDDPENYAFIRQGRRDRTLTAFALNVADYFAQTTERLRGTVCFSATMDPLEDMRKLLGGTAEDACFAMPSPFPKENLLLLRERVNTRYHQREGAVQHIARSVCTLWQSKPGRYMAFFPSFAFMEQTAQQLDVPHRMQGRKMTDEERRAFLAPYVQGGEPALSLCVLGGIFAEGIDLPGDALDGVIVVGVGLPQVNIFQETLRHYYQETLGNGFLYAYMIPGMQKVAQAVGRVIRTETDRGAALLLDDRYAQSAYRRLCPEHWIVQEGRAEQRLCAFWQAGAVQDE